jgi:anionic cell wall polymer biosynthesis LytR-Cps2A-Psr (LCP) family protein
VALVDELGGVRLNVSAPVSDQFTGLSLPSGCSQLDGDTALGFVRSRHLVVNGVDDPTGDLGRIGREEAFVAVALSQLSNAATDPVALDRYADILGDHALLDDTLDFTHLVALARELHGVDPAAIESLAFPSTPAIKDGAAVLTSTAADADAARRFLIDGTRPTSLIPPRPEVPPLTITGC